MKRDHITEILWGALGAALGSATIFVSTVSKIYDGGAISVTGFVGASIFVVGLAIAAFCGFLWFNRHTSGGRLEDRIRSRPRDQVAT